MLFFIQKLLCAVTADDTWIRFLFTITSDCLDISSTQKDFRMLVGRTACLALDSAHSQYFALNVQRELYYTQSGSLVLPDLICPQITAKFLNDIKELLMIRIDKLEFITQGLTECEFKEMFNDLIEKIKLKQFNEIRYNMFMNSLLYRVEQAFIQKSYQQLANLFQELNEEYYLISKSIKYEKYRKLIAKKISPTGQVPPPKSAYKVKDYNYVSSNEATKQSSSQTQLKKPNRASQFLAEAALNDQITSESKRNYEHDRVSRIMNTNPEKDLLETRKGYTYGTMSRGRKGGYHEGEDDFYERKSYLGDD